MDPNLLTLLVFVAFAVMGFVFARNVYVGLRTGVVWARGGRYRRDERPILFWIAWAVSAVMTVVSIGIVVVGAAVLWRAAHGG